MSRPPIDWDKLTPEERKAMVQTLLEGEKKHRSPTLDDIPFSMKVLALFGLPAESNPNELERAPLITYLMIGTCAVVSYLCFHNEELFTSLAMYPSQFWRFGGLNFLSCFFVHAGWTHLLSNMYCLFVFGDNVEDVMGKAKYVLLLIAATFLGSLVSLIFGEMSAIPHVGASGGIFGVMVYYLLRFRSAKFTYFFFFQFFHVPAIVVLAIYSFSQVTGVFAQLQGGSEVDALAHLGGGLAGLFFWLYERRPKDESPSDRIPWA